MALGGRSPLASVRKFGLREGSEHLLHDALALLFGSGVCEDGQKGIQHVLCPRETQLSRIQG